MTQSVFIEWHDKIRHLVVDNISAPDTSAADKRAITYLLDALDSINYENRLRMKGLLSRIVVDTLDFANPIGDEILLFDKNL